VVVLQKQKKTAEAVIEALYGLELPIYLCKNLSRAGGADIRFCGRRSGCCGNEKTGCRGEFRSNFDRGA